MHRSRPRTSSEPIIFKVSKMFMNSDCIPVCLQYGSALTLVNIYVGGYVIYMFNVNFNIKCLVLKIKFVSVEVNLRSNTK